MTKLIGLIPEVETHSHTVLSGHAWSTLIENIGAAKKIGIKKICMTEHGPAMPGVGAFFISGCQKMVSEEYDGIKIVKGLEFNIVDHAGTLDVTDPAYLNGVEFGIASMHDVCVFPKSKAAHTACYEAVLENPYVDMLGHPGTPAYMCDIEHVVRCAKAKNKLIEINAHSVDARKGCIENCIEFARQCKKQDVRICVSSDAHFVTMIGEVSKAMELLTSIEFPSELILNLELGRFDAYLAQRAARF